MSGGYRGKSFVLSRGDRFGGYAAPKLFISHVRKTFIPCQTCLTTIFIPTNDLKAWQPNFLLL